MRITVEMYGPLQRFNKDGQLRAELEVKENETVRGVLTGLGMDPKEPWNAGLDGRMANPSDQLHEGSLLIVFTPVEGG